MSDKSRVGHKEPNRQPLVGRQLKAYLSSKVVAMIRANDTTGQFSHPELVHIESLLKDELNTNQWLLNVCKAVTEDAVVVTQHQLDLFNEHKNEGKEVYVNPTEVEELRKELHFLKERVHVLKYIQKDLTEKLTKIQILNNTMHSNHTNDSNNTYAKLRIKLTESLEIMKRDLNSEFTVDEPKDIAEEITTELNKRLVSIDSIEKPSDWMCEQLDELALTDMNQKQLLEAINGQNYHKLDEICKNLMHLNDECQRIKQFYDVNVREEMSWRTDLNTILRHFHESNESQIIRLNSMQNKRNELQLKISQTEEYYKLVKNVENQEMDEFRALIEALKQRIEMLTKN
ncbi:unnamed protein product [Medioppia subpectinata]|uniref:Uncharacterized protein n=1 Tax=Medioppia subpectinata TaxID=1979941 RepID=A0A7R9LCZ6_9ACAR|nr:unnamed protein product [Medioppia subpectinata]CAG2117834.1 unnamed protein product [Medioppia subpectinata]